MSAGLSISAPLPCARKFRIVRGFPSPLTGWIVSWTSSSNVRTPTKRLDLKPASQAFVEQCHSEQNFVKLKLSLKIQVNIGKWIMKMRNSIYGSSPCGAANSGSQSGLEPRGARRVDSCRCPTSRKIGVFFVRLGFMPLCWPGLPRRRRNWWVRFSAKLAVVTM